MKMFHSGGRAAIALALGALLVLSLAAPAAAANPGRPFLGHAVGTGTIAPATSACPTGSMFLAGEQETGNFTHLGRVDSTWSHCAVVDWATGFGRSTASGSITMTAANGDRLMLSYDMTFQATPMPLPTTAVAHIDWFVTGGTGRFAAATGSGEVTMTVAYTADLTGAATSEVWSGTIRY